MSLDALDLLDATVSLGKMVCPDVTANQESQEPRVTLGPQEPLEPQESESQGREELPDVLETLDPQDLPVLWALSEP